RRGPAPAADAGPAQPSLLRRDVRHLPAAAGPLHGPPVAGAARPGLPARLGEGGRGGPFARGGEPMTVIVVGGGLAGLTAACQLARSGHQVTLVEARA